MDAVVERRVAKFDIRNSRQALVGCCATVWFSAFSGPSATEVHVGGRDVVLGTETVSLKLMYLK